MKASLAKGTRDFLPGEVKRRDYIFNTIEKVFKKYGFDKIETPAIENLQTLTGKYGDEGDQLLFKVLNNGDFLKKADKNALEAMDSNALAPSISKRGLRYDLTVPFSRFVVMNQQHINLPFKRYQIQPVWRGDRPQKGRYQEFYQCDVDVIGTDSLLCEAELCLIYDEVFTALKLDVDIRINNRKILMGMAEILNAADRVTDLTVTIDKLDKIGLDGVEKILLNDGFIQEQVDKLKDLLSIKSLEELKEYENSSEALAKGISELEEIFFYLENQTIHQNLIFDVSLARGLDYYTGMIIEVVGHDTDYGSLGGGGRYDDLTAVFGLKNVSGVGISFGAARIYDSLNELNLFPEDIEEKKDALIITMDKESLKYGFELVQKLRADNYRVDIFPDNRNFGRQMRFADKEGVKYAILIGSNEIKEGKVTLKDMSSGEEKKLTTEELSTLLENNVK